MSKSPVTQIILEVQDGSVKNYLIDSSRAVRPEQTEDVTAAAGLLSYLALGVVETGTRTPYPIGSVPWCQRVVSKEAEAIHESRASHIARNPERGCPSLQEIDDEVDWVSRLLRGLLRDRGAVEDVRTETRTLLEERYTVHTTAIFNPRHIGNRHQLRNRQHFLYSLAMKLFPHRAELRQPNGVIQEPGA